MMADEYIKRSELHGLLRSGCYGHNINSSEVHAVIDKIPSADVAPVKHGRWEKQIQCSECGWYFEDDVLIEPMLVFFNYCPNCGARMDGGT